jgi:hydrogenase maturation protein HypF
MSCLAENGLEGPAIGVAYDGLGYGTDGHLWGGEILLAGASGFTRKAHLREAPLPGGTAAVRRPYRMALGYLFSWLPSQLEAFAPFLDRLDPREVDLIRRQVARGLNSPPTSSCGRLFDAVSALLGVCPTASYEGQAAMELQALADRTATGSYPFDLVERDGVRIIDPAPLLVAVAEEHRDGVPVPTIAMRFHRAVAEFTAGLCRRLAAETGLRQVAFSGGVFQNTLLLEETLARLEGAGLGLYFHRRLPANDGGLSLGQAIIAHRQTVREERTGCGG